MKSIEFFHNIVCSYCFIQSRRFRKIFEDYPDIQIKHRSFPLRYQNNKEDFPFKMYDDSGDILSHWERANQLDEEHRFNISGMREKDFDFPTSRLAEIAIKAAVKSEGDEIHWDIFDHFQHALFVRNLNIADDRVVRDLIQETDIDYDSWENYYEAKKPKMNYLKIIKK